MTQQEWENASDEERQAEHERCKDPVYFYNTYWIKPDGSKPDPITKEQWSIIEINANKMHLKRRTPRRNNILSPDECFIIPKFTKP